MGAYVWNSDWLDSNSVRSFPLMEGDSHVDQSGAFSIPKDLLLDAAIPVEYSSSLDFSDIFIKSITASTSQIIVVVYSGSSKMYEFKYLSSYGDKYTVAARQSRGNLIGRMTFGVDPLSTITSGHFTFESSSSRFVPACIHVAPQSVRSLSFVNGVMESEKLTGDVRLMGSGSVVLSRSGNTILINCQARATAATDEEDEDNCDPLSKIGIPSGATPIRTINGVAPNDNGEITITSLEGLSITSSGSTVNISNPNAEPCCTNEDVESTLDSIESLETSVAALEKILTDLQAKYEEMNEVVNASDI